MSFALHPMLNLIITHTGSVLSPFGRVLLGEARQLPAAGQSRWVNDPVQLVLLLMITVLAVWIG